MLVIDDQFVTQLRVDKTISPYLAGCPYTRDPSYIEIPCGSSLNAAACIRKFRAFILILRHAVLHMDAVFIVPLPAIWNTLRQMILRDDPTYKKAQAAYARQRIFAMEGGATSSPHYADQPGGKGLCGLERRNIGFSKGGRDFDLLYSDRLARLWLGRFGDASASLPLLLAAAQGGKICVM